MPSAVHCTQAMASVRSENSHCLYIAFLRKLPLLWNAALHRICMHRETRYLRNAATTDPAPAGACIGHALGGITRIHQHDGGEVATVPNNAPDALVNCFHA